MERCLELTNLLPELARELSASAVGPPFEAPISWPLPPRLEPRAKVVRAYAQTLVFDMVLLIKGAGQPVYFWQRGSVKVVFRCVECAALLYAGTPKNGGRITKPHSS